MLESTKKDDMTHLQFGPKLILTNKINNGTRINIPPEEKQFGR